MNSTTITASTCGPQSVKFTRDLSRYTIRRLSKMVRIGPNTFLGNYNVAKMEELVLQSLAPFMELQAETSFADLSQLFLESYSELISQFTTFCEDSVTGARVAKTVEAALIFGVNLLRSSSGTDIFLALTSFIQATSTQSMTQTLYDTFVVGFAEAFTENFQTQSFGLEDLTPMLDTLRGKFTLLTSISEVPIVKKLFKFVLYCLSFSLLDIFGITFDRLGYTKFEAEAIRKAHLSKAGFVFCVFDSLTLFMKQFVRAVSSGSWEPFYHCTSTYEKFVDDAIALRNKEKYLSNPEPHGFDLFTYRAELEDAIDRGNTIMRNIVNVSAFERTKLKSLLCDLALLKANDITRKSAQRDRPAPFGIMLAGGSSLGKSTLITYLFQHYAKLHNRSSESTAKYTRNSAEKHWNGFASSQWCIVLDDIAAQNPSLGSMDESLSEVICVLNNVAFVPEQAALEDKGKTPVLAELVIASTNTVDLNAHAYFSCPLAVQRRLPWVVGVTVKAEFATNGMLDHTKCSSSKEDGKYADYWNFQVQRIVPVECTAGTRQRGKTEVVDTFTHVEDFLAWFGKETFVHNKVQTLIGVQELDTNTILACATCCRPVYGCACEMEPQATTMSFAIVPYEAAKATTSALYFFLQPISCLWRWWSTTDPWCECDTSDLCYTAGVFSFAVGCYFLTYLFGALFAWASGFSGWWLLRFCQFDFEGKYLRFMFRRMGQRMQRFCGPVKIYLMLFLTLATAAKVAHVTHNYMFPARPVPTCTCQLPVEEVAEEEKVEQDFVPETDPVDVGGTRPVSNLKERVNVWYKEEYNVTNFDVSPQTLSMKALDHDQVRNLFRRNCLRVAISVDGVKWSRTGALALCGQLYAINTHAFPRPAVQWIVRVMPDSQCVGVTRNKEFLVVETQMIVMTDSDITYVALRGMPLAPNILPYLALPSIKGKYVGEYIGYNKEGVAYEKNSVLHVECDTYPYVAGVPWSVYSGRSSRATEKGDCGAPLLVFTPLGPVIFGIHSLGNTQGLVKAAPVYADDARLALSRLRLMEMQSGSPFLTAPSATNAPLVGLDRRSPLRYIEAGAAIVYGSFAGFRAAPKSRVARTDLADVAEEFGYVQLCGAPAMSGWQPWRTAMLDMVDIPNGFRQDLVDHCVDSFSHDIFRDLPEEALKEVFVYDLFTAVNGAAGVAYVDKMKRNTSAGFPWNTSKGKFLNPIEPQHGLSDPVEFTPEITNRVAQMIATYEAGERVMPVFTGHLKDEPTTFAKIQIGKTRVFGGAPVDWSIVERMYLLPIIRLIQSNRYVFESAPGTIAQSKEWGDMYHYLTHFGVDRIVAGDYKAFDKKMPATFILAAFEVMTNICAAAGYTRKQLSVVYGLAHDTAFPLFNLNGDLVEFYGSNPSGHPLTVIVNGLANALYMRYCYTLLNPKVECDTFKQRVNLMTYGDDNVMGVSAQAPWFNHTAIQETLAVHGVVYTMADKTSESVPYIPISDVSFLKRSWRWDDEVLAYLCPLEHASIEKSIMTCVVSKSVSTQYQAVAIVSSAVNEYFFYGKEEFHRRSTILREIVSKSGLDAFVEDSTFPSYGSLVERFQSYDVDLQWTPKVEESG